MMSVRRPMPSQLAPAVPPIKTTRNGHIAIRPDGSFALTRAGGGPLSATFADDMLEALNAVAALMKEHAASPPPAMPDHALVAQTRAAEAGTAQAAMPAHTLAAQAPLLTPEEQTIAAHVIRQLRNP